MKTIRFTNATDELSFDTTAPNAFHGCTLSINKFQVSAYRPRVGVQMKYGKSGGISTGDGEVDARTITIGVDLSVEQSGSSDYSYIQAMDALLGFFRLENSPFYLYDDQDDSASGADLPRRAKIVLEDENLTSSKDSERVYMKGDIKFSMLDGLWEDADPNTYESGTGGIANGGTFNLVNSTSYRSFPVYTLTALADISLFRLTNQTSDVFIEIGTSAFTVGEDLVIDCNDGTITVGGVSITATALSDGSSFPDLLPGTNTIEYTSADGSVEISVEYRGQYGR